MAVAVDTGQGSQDVVGSVRNQHCVMVRVQRAIVADEVEQMWHLLQVGGHVGVVALQVGVVELNVDDVLNPAVSGVELAEILRSRRSFNMYIYPTTPYYSIKATPSAPATIADLSKSHRLLVCLGRL